MNSKLIDPVPVGIDPVAWRATRRLRESIAELHKIYSAHMAKAHKWNKVCLCQEMDNYNRSYAYLKNNLNRALFPPDLNQKRIDINQLMNLLNDNVIDEETVKKLLLEEPSHE